MQNVMQNPAFMQMAEKLGTQMMQDPQMASMMQQMQDPATTEKMKAKMEELKEDPEMAEIMREIETGGPSAMMKYWNDPKVLQKISGAMGDVMPGMPRDAGETADAGEEEESEEEDDGEETVHTAASAGDAEALKELIDGGADVNAKDGEGRTAPALRVRLRRDEVRRDAQRRQGGRERDGQEQEHAAALRRGVRKSRRVQVSRRRGRLRHPRNQDGKSPLDVAKLNDQDDVVAALEADVFL